MADWLDDVVAPRESGGRPNIGWRNTDLTPWLEAGQTVYGFPDWPGLPGPAGTSTAAGLYGITKTNWKHWAPRLGVNDFSPASQRRVADAIMATQGKAAWAASEPGYKSGLHRPEGYYGGALNVTVRPPGAEPEPFPIDAALDALLRGDPAEGEDTGDPFQMLDDLLAEPQQAAAPAPPAEAEVAAIEAPAARRAAEPIAEPLAPMPPAAPIVGLPESGPQQILDRLLAAPAEQAPATPQAAPPSAPVPTQTQPDSSSLLDSLLSGLTSSMRAGTNILPGAGRGVRRGAEAGFTGRPIEGPPTSAAEAIGMVPGGVAGSLLSPLRTGGEALQAAMTGQPVSAEEMLSASTAGLTGPVTRLPGGVPGEVPRIHSAVRGALGDEGGAVRLFHGAARPFDPAPGAPLGRFDPARMGSGEGYHGEGRGGYGSEALKVARWYQREYGEYPTDIVAAAKAKLAAQYPAGSGIDSTSGMRHRFTGEESNYAEYLKKIGLDPDRPSEWVRAAERETDFEPGAKGGALYEMEHPTADPEHFLRWDLPVSQQSDYVKQRLRRLGVSDTTLTGNDVLLHLAQKYGGPTDPGTFTWASLAKGDEQAANVLKLTGIRGVRYPAGGQAGREGAFNYSVFEPEAMNVLRRLRDDESGALNLQKIADDIKNLRDTRDAAVRDLQIKVTPMAAGEDAGRAVAKDYANSERKARFWRSEFDGKLRKLSAVDQKNMWEAMDRASVEAQTIGGEAGIAAGMRHIHALPPAQQKILMDMERRGIQLWEQARDVGMVAEGAERLPFYVMRGIVEVADEGVSRLASRAGTGQGLTNVDQFGVNLTTRGPMSRGFLTAEQTEAAAKKLSENAEIVRNIRVLPMAYERFEKAIAGRRLINDLKEIGEATGKPLVKEGEKLSDNWVTIPHPAFKTYGPTYGADGKVIRDPATGRIVPKQSDIYVSREVEGPMRSIMRGETGWWYNASMQLKGAAMATIMNSPVIHNFVEYGRALGAMPGRVGSFKIYFTGNQVRKNPQLMERAIQDGLVPIGQRGYMQDIEGIATGMDLAPGRGLLAKGVGALTDVVSPQAGQAVRRGIDRAGDFWHQTLLWDRVADLQAGLYNEFAKDLIKKGIDRDSASKMAAHFANRFAGAVPNEAMSEGAKKLLNFVLFSRSFTTGNLGVMKDMFTGLPRDVQAQLGRNLTALEKKATTSVARRKAIGTVMVDVGLMYLSNEILQNGIEMLRDDKSLDDISHDYAERLSEVLRRTKENPLDLLDPYSDIGPRSLSALSTNEPGKSERVRLGYREDGSAIYIRPPIGKIGEEFEGLATRPLEMFRNKEGTTVRPLLNVLENDRGFGGRVEQVYNRNPNSLGEAAGAVGSILWEFMRSQTPEQQLKAGARMLSGKGDWVDMAQTLAPFAGFTISRGAPGGEAVGEMYAAKGEHGDRVRAALPEIRDLVRDQKYDEAQQKLQELNVPVKLQRYYMRVYGTPEARLSPRAMRDFNRYATPEQQRRMNIQMQRRDERDQRLRSPAAGP